ncbi:TPA: helix-turn-helix transcriptional regulator [Stenotrophomonas maltophilia]|nr:helix-turn-helix transcriptional regulator [Stenotrophomonas maltophilia]HEL4296593.1 helix-turn-helix transcriptional regulator [Stenotrophomonas maltophilia]HEL4810615.1 helix-turn-helix transcriptional regulator [Stenotrophomonas maltophilia]
MRIAWRRESGAGAKVIGQRLIQARGDVPQTDFAAQLGIPKSTYVRYERGEREPDLRTCLALHSAGWNLNWVLTGEGPERLADLGGAVASHPVSHKSLTIALQQVEEVVAEHQLPMPPSRKADLALAVADLIEEGMPEAKVLRFVRAAAA